ncbi:hypothetical protein C0995_013831 [Termitomyces sp. Mi166|nr:hypothetical protein C0995_013831 [Termitomyces sp. Mi166\
MEVIIHRHLQHYLSKQDKTLAELQKSCLGFSTNFDKNKQLQGRSRERQIQELLSLLLHHVPEAEPLIRPLVNHVHDFQLLQQAIGVLNGPLTQEQFLEIEGFFMIPQDDQEELIRTLNDPNDPGISLILFQFRELVERLTGHPIPDADEVPTAKCVSALGLAQPSPEQPNGTDRFPIHEFRESRFRRFIVEPFTCTACQTNIPAACCVDVRAMAIFEYLSVFDKDYLTRVRNFHRGAADAHTHANRLSFLTHAFDLANRRDARFHGFISVLKRTLKYVHFWLEPSIPENVPCSAVYQMLATSFLLEVVRAFLARGIETLAEFRARGYIIHRIVNFLFNLSRQPEGPLYDLIGSSPLVIDQSAGLNRLIWVSDSVWEGHFPPGEDPAILEYMHDLWTRLEINVGSESLQSVADEFDARLYERGHDLSPVQRA